MAVSKTFSAVNTKLVDARIRPLNMNSSDPGIGPGDFADVRVKPEPSLDERLKVSLANTNDIDAQCQSLNKLAKWLYVDGNLQDSHLVYQKSIELASADGNQQRLSEAWSGIGTVHRRLGTIRDAVHAFTQALDIDRKIFGSAHQAVASDLRQLAICYDYMGDRAKAELFQQQARQVEIDAFKLRKK